MYFTYVTNVKNCDVSGIVPQVIASSVIGKMQIKEINHTKLE